MDQAEFEEFLRKIQANITKAEPGKWQNLDNDPVLLKKEQEAYEAIKKNPFPDYIQKMIEKG